MPYPLPARCRKIDAEGSLVCPSLWEPHIHGCGGFSTDNASTESLKGMAGFLAARGIGAFLPTTVADEGYLTSLGEALAGLDENGGVRSRIPGLHVEGPFVSPSRRGGIPERLAQPYSPAHLERLVAAARECIRVMTFAPELSGAMDLTARLRAKDIVPSLGHSEAKLADLRPYDGLSPLCVTHLFNCMSGVSHKEPGLAHWALLDRGVYTELICDGTHVHDAAIHLALRVRPWERIILSSDAFAPAGMDGEPAAGLTLYGAPIASRGGGVYYADSGTLVGSRFLVPHGISRLVSEFKVPVERAVAMASLNPARLLGFERKGALLPGYDADVAVFTKDFSRCEFLAWQGKPVFEERGVQVHSRAQEA